ncbi:MAG: DNA polymerase Y family protein [Parasphingorhabdus sp.]|nr:DNA polymerase Y family protein [Parasphingorhabdus sp.]
MPHLAVERAIRSGIAPRDAPFALTEKQRGAVRLIAVDPIAASLGITPGLTLADARARVPDLAAIDCNPAADAALLERIGDFCARYSPAVMVDPPATVLIDISGCAHLFGGEHALCDDLCARVGAQRFTPRLGLAQTPDAARALARHGGDDVQALPVEALDMAAEVGVALRRAGLKRIADLAAIPRAALAARFGSDLTLRLARLLGQEDAHIVRRVMAEPVRAETRFAEPVGRNDDVLDTIEALVREVSVTLEQRGAGGRAFAVQLFRSDGHVAQLLVETAAPTRDAQQVMRLIGERIDSLADPLDPGFGYDRIALAVPRFDPLAEAQQQLDPAPSQKRAIAPLLDRLAVRHGGDALRRFAPGDSHLPERAALLPRFDGALPAMTWPDVAAGEPPLRPLTLFHPPQRVEVLAEVPDGPPRRFRWRGGIYLVVRQEGPERIAPEWWRRRSTPALTRDYYRVEDSAGHRFWLFRHGLYGQEAVTPEWYVHGLFA